MRPTRSLVETFVATRPELSSFRGSACCQMSLSSTRFPMQTVFVLSRIARCISEALLQQPSWYCIALSSVMR
jgi:hypothetical protein